MRVQAAGVQPGRGPVGGRRRFVAAGFEERLAEADVRVQAAGVQPGSGPVGGRGLLVPAQLAERLA